MRKFLAFILLLCSPLWGISVENGATDVTVYFNLHDTDGTMLTGETVTTFDLYYIEDGAAISAKADATAHAAATDAHTDNEAFEIGQGIYRVDFPDAAFDGGVKKRVQLVLVYNTSYNAVIEVELSPPVNVTRINGDAQTATDLKDFADTGYNPATHRVAYVTTVGETGGYVTVGTNNDKTGYSLSSAGIDAVWDEVITGHTTANTTGKALTDALADTDDLQTNQGNWATAVGFSTHDAADVVNEWETQSQADPTGFHVNVLEIGGTAQTANDNGADINAILTDTDELQTNQGNWATAVGFSTHDAADVVNEWETQSQADPTGFHVNVLEVGGTAQTANDNGADINAALTDTNELQTDWTNGGRLDLLLDAVSTHDAAAVVTALMADTGITAGGTMTFETWCKVVGAAVAGDFKDKAGGGYELFDVEDGTTVIFSQTISETTPYRDTTME